MNSDVRIGIVCIAVMIAIFFNVGNNIETNEWKSFRAETLKKYPFVNNSYIYSIRPTLFIGFTLKEVDKKEIEKIFNDTKSFLMLKNVFDDFQIAHSKRYGGSIIDIIIEFRLANREDSVEYLFSTSIKKDEMSKEYDFRNWRIEDNGTTEEYFSK